ncbi:MAG: hypothetical protein F4X58_06405 [Chloroflexi bacterium]|nr:hypothetical protein [Chloroflexota bacterium]
MAYRITLHADAPKVIAQKLQPSLALDGIFRHAYHLAAAVEDLMVGADRDWTARNPEVQVAALLGDAGASLVIELVLCCGHHSKVELQRALANRACFLADQLE